MDIAELAIKVDSSGAKQGINEVQTGMDGIISKAQLVSAAMVAVGAALVALGTAFDDANRSILVATGATGDLADTLQNDLLAVLNEVPDSMANVAKVIGTLNTLTGQSGEGLQDMATQILNVSRLLGEEAGPNAETFGKLIKQWDVPLEQNADLMDKLYVITQDYGVSLSKLSGDLVTFGPIMDNAGFSIEETAVIMGQMNAAGVDWTRIAPGLNAATRKLAEEGITDMKGALMGTIEQIRTAETETEALAIATEQFGAEGAQRMVSGVRDGAFALEEMNEVLAGSKGAINDAALELETLGDKMGKLTNQIKVALEPAASAVVDILKLLADNADVVAVALGAAGLTLAITGLVGVLGTATAGIGLMNTALLVLGMTLGTLQKLLTGPLGIALLVGSAAAAIYAFSRDTETAMVNVRKKIEETEKAMISWHKVLSSPIATIAQLTNTKTQIKAFQDETEALYHLTAARLLDLEAIYKVALAQDPMHGMYQDIIELVNTLQVELEDLGGQWETQEDLMDQIDDRIEELNTSTISLTGATGTLTDATVDATDAMDDQNAALVNYLGTLSDDSSLEDFADKLWEVEDALDAGKISAQQHETVINTLYGTFGNLAGSATESATALNAAGGEMENITDKADPYADAWTAAIERVDSAFADAWKGAFDSFTDFADAIGDAFKQLLAELAHAAITRPITIMLGLGGAGGAQAGGVGSLFGGDGGFLGGLGNLFGGNSISAGANNLWGSLFGGGSGNMSGFIGPPSPGMSPVFGGSNMGIGIAGLLGGLFGNQFGGEYGGIGGGMGAGIGFMMGGPIGGIIGALLGTGGSLIGGDDNENSLLKLFFGDEGFNKTSDRPWEETGFGAVGFNKDGDVNRGLYDAILGSLGFSGQHIGNPNDDQISQEDFNAWVAAMDAVMGQVMQMDKDIVSVLGLGDEKIAEIVALTEALKGETAKMSEPNIMEHLKDRYRVVFDAVGGMADDVFDAFDAMATDAPVDELVYATLTVVSTVDELGGGFTDLGTDMVNMTSQILASSSDISLIDATMLTAGFVSALDTMTTLFDDLDKAFSSNADSMWGSMEDLTSFTWDMVDAFDGSATSVLNLTQGMYDQMNATEQVMRAIQDMKRASSDMITDLKEKIRLEYIGLTGGEEAQKGWIEQRIGRLMGGLYGLTDPDAIASQVGQITGLYDQLWSMLSDEEKKSQGQSFIEMLNDLDSLAARRYENAENILETRHDALIDAITSRFEGFEFSEFVSAAGDMASSVTDFNSGATDIMTAATDFKAAATDILTAATALEGAAESGGVGF